MNRLILVLCWLFLRFRQTSFHLIDDFLKVLSLNAYLLTNHGAYTFPKRCINIRQDLLVLFHFGMFPLFYYIFNALHEEQFRLVQQLLNLFVRILCYRMRERIRLMEECGSCEQGHFLQNQSFQYQQYGNSGNPQQIKYHQTHSFYKDFTRFPKQRMSQSTYYYFSLIYYSSQWVQTLHNRTAFLSSLNSNSNLNFSKLRYLWAVRLQVSSSRQYLKVPIRGLSKAYPTDWLTREQWGETRISINQGFLVMYGYIYWMMRYIQCQFINIRYYGEVSSIVLFRFKMNTGCCQGSRHSPQQFVKSSSIQYFLFVIGPPFDCDFLNALILVRFRLASSLKMYSSSTQYYPQDIKPVLNSFWQSSFNIVYYYIDLEDNLFPRIQFVALKMLGLSDKICVGKITLGLSLQSCTKYCLQLQTRSQIVFLFMHISSSLQNVNTLSINQMSLSSKAVLMSSFIQKKLLQSDVTTLDLSKNWSLALMDSWCFWFREGAMFILSSANHYLSLILLFYSNSYSLLINVCLFSETDIQGLRTYLTFGSLQRQINEFIFPDKAKCQMLFKICLQVTISRSMVIFLSYVQNEA